MADQPDKPKSGPSGRSLRWTPEQIAQQALVGPEDARAARAHWRRLAPAKYRSLIDAKPTRQKPRQGS